MPTAEEVGAAIAAGKPLEPGPTTADPTDPKNYPAKTGDAPANAEDLGQRVLMLEACVSYILSTTYRGVAPQALLDQYNLDKAGSEVLDPTAKGR